MTGYATLPDTILAKRLATIESQLRALSTSPRAGHTAIAAGSLDILDSAGRKVAAYGVQDDGTVALQVFDAAGVVRATLGQLAAGEFGIMLADANGQPAFQVTDGGIDSPAIPLPFRATNSSLALTSATFLQMWQFAFGKVTHDSIRVVVPASADAATTGSIRLEIFRDGVSFATSAAQTILAASPSRYTWSWTPGWTVGDAARWAIVVEGERLTGVGDVNIGEPDLGYLARGDTIGATPTGV